MEREHWHTAALLGVVCALTAIFAIAHAAEHHYLPLIALLAGFLYGRRTAR